MSEPKRIQRKRTKGWRMPEGAIYVGRPTVWGNPFAVVRAPHWPSWGGPAPYLVEALDGKRYHPQDSREVILGRAPAEAASKWRAAALAMEMFRCSHTGFIDSERARAELGGHDLACWCPLDQPCHADVLLKIANQLSEQQEERPSGRPSDERRAS